MRDIFAASKQNRLLMVFVWLALALGNTYNHVIFLKKKNSTFTDDGTVNKNKAKENDEMFNVYLLGLTYLLVVFKSIQPASYVFPITFPLFNFISHPCAAVCFALDVFSMLLNFIPFWIFMCYSWLWLNFFFSPHFEMRHRSTAHQLLTMCCVYT